MSLAEYKWELDGYIVEGLTEVTGFDAPEIELHVSRRAGAHGAWVSGKHLAERVITMQGRHVLSAETLHNDSESVALGLPPQDVNALKMAFEPTATDVYLRFQLPGLPEQYCKVKSQGVRYALRAIETTTGLFEFLGTVVAGDPRIYSATEQSVTLNAGASSVTGHGFPHGFPLSFGGAGSSGTGSANASNAGNFAAPTVLTFDGPLTNPGIINDTTGAYFKILLSIGTGDQVVVDSLSNTILYNGASRYGNMDPTSTFIELIAGQNQLHAIADGGTGSVTLEWRDTWF